MARKILTAFMLGMPMERERKRLLLSAVAVGSAAVFGYIGQRRRRPSAPKSETHVRATVVDEAPAGATVVDVDDLDRVPVARSVVRRALRSGARDEWVTVAVESDAAGEIVDIVRHELPYYTADGPAPEGVYVRHDRALVVINAAGWVLLDPPGR